MKRTDLLIERSLKSVYEQKDMNPYAIYIVDDNEKQNTEDEYSTEYHNIKFRVKQFRKEFFSEKFEDGKVPPYHFHTTVLPNRRTHGNSGTGAWNTAIYRARREGSKKFKRKIYIAILDDDDEWDPNYLKRCLDKVNKEKVKEPIGVVSGIKRIEEDSTEKIIPDPECFTQKDFLIGNPGFQGSNIFLRLRELLYIGGFDESLKSATDRDLGIRLVQYCNKQDDVTLEFIQEPLVFHYADEDQRVTANKENKKRGLDVFYRKYMHLMDEETRDLSMQRAKKLFDYEYDEVHEKPKEPTNKFSKSDLNEFNLIVGTITDNKDTIKSFLESFSKMDFDALNDYLIVILENAEKEFEVRPIIRYFKEEKGLNIDFLTLESQKDIVKEKWFRKLFDHEKPGERKSIAFNRSIIQYYCYQKSKKLFGLDNVVWIIDDDNKFECLIGDERLDTIIPKNYFEMISYYKEENIADAILGTVVDAPPLPFLSTLRTQVLDIYFTLEWFSNQDPKAKFDRNYSHNYPFIKNNRDFYYDMSSDFFTHLECPFWWLPIGEQPETNYDAFKLFLQDLGMLKDGTNICRPLCLAENRWGDENGQSVFRGGNTIIFDLEMLKVPNMIPEIKYEEEKISARRSDFNWTLVNKFIFGKEIRQVKLPLRHDRRLQSSGFQYNREKLIRDIYGRIFYRVYKDLLDEGIDNLEEKHYEKARKKFQSLFRRNISMLKINLERTRILLEWIIDELENTKNWWYGKQKYREETNLDLNVAISSMKSIEFDVEKRKSQDLEAILEDYKKIDVEMFKEIIEKTREIRSQVKG